MFTPLKVAIARTACRPTIGRAIARLYGDRIPLRGFRFQTGSSAIAPTTKAQLFWGFYESSERRLLARHVAGDLDVVELGSSLGVVSTFVASRLRPGRRLVGVEANDALIPLALGNIAANLPDVPVSIEHGAIHYGAETVSFEIGAESVGSRLGTGDRAVTVPAIRLSDLLRTHGIDRYDLVSDIEGAEAEVLRFDAEALRGCRSIVIELHHVTEDGRDLTPDDLLGRLQALGFTLIERHGPVCALTRPS